MAEPSDRSARLAGLSAAKRALLERRLRGEDLGRPTLPRRSSDEGPIPLSCPQERMWFLQQLDPEQTSYNFTWALRLRGALDVAALGRTLVALVRRHDALRTVFRVEGDRPVQAVQAEPMLAFSVDAPVASPPDAREEWALHAAADEARRPFDLARGPLVRARLLPFAPDDHVLLLMMHHIVTDGWSMGILAAELGVLYEASRSGRPAPLAELPCSYADFAAWQRRRLAAGELDAQLAAWEQRLAGARLVLDLPLDHPRPARRTNAGAQAPVRLTRELSEQVKDFARGAGATPFMVLMAAFVALLHRYTGQDDLVVGTPAANRTTTESEAIVGCFINTLPLRIRVDGRPGFRELVGRVGEAARGAYAHQELPFERLVEALVPTRDLGRAPIVQALFVLQNAPMGRLELDGLSIERIEVPAVAAKLDLTLELSTIGDVFVGRLVHATELLDVATGERMARHLVRLLSAALAEPDRPLPDLAMLTPGELRQLGEWNATETPVDRDADPVGQIRGHAAATPDAVALEGEATRVTYRELDARSERMAAALAVRGVAGRIVGLLAERSIEAIVAMLAVWKAGAAFTPLDPEHPPARLRHQARQAVLVLTRRTHASLAERLGREVALLDDLAAPALEGPLRTLDPEALAYVIYTSGSTGAPKGVAVGFQALINHLAWRRRTFPLALTDRFLHKAPLGFDIALWEIFSPLTEGACVVLADPGGHRDPVHLTRLLDERRVTVAHFAPALLAAMLDEPRFHRVATLRRVFVGGESLTPALAARFFAASAAELVHQYGPTEACIDATAWVVSRADLTGPIPIGRPIANTSAWVLDDAGRPAPIGVVGELHLGGACLARGYLGRPDLTAERFVPDGITGASGARLYRTGDLARLRGDGAIVFVGRRDRQVKLRGIRIELGEIEAALRELPGVREAVAQLWQAAPDDPRLVAYVVHDAGIAADSLRHALRERLPEALVPAAILALEQLPRLSSGKVDLLALPAPTWTSPATAEAPIGAVEITLAALWREVLGVARVGRADNFFDLGGHSLLATRVMARIRDRLGAEVPLRRLFETPTIAGLARALETAARAGPPIELGSGLLSGGAVVLSGGQERLWFLQQLDPGSVAYNSVHALRVRGRLDVDGLRRAIATIVRRHAPLRMRIVDVDGAPRGILDDEAIGRVELVDGPVEAVAREQGERAFDLAREHPLRACLVREAEEQYVLVVTVHHAFADGWSTEVFLRELDALVQGRTPPPLSVQYADWAASQRTWVSAGGAAAGLEFWRRQLADLARLDLPTDRSRRGRRGRSGVVPIRLGRELVGELDALARREGATRFMALLAGLQALLARLSGQTDVAVGTPVINRRRPELEDVIGFFVNTVVLRVDLRAGPSFAELLRRVRGVVLGAFSHDDVPFELVVDAVDAERDRDRQPLFDVAFTLRDTSPLRFGELPLESVELPPMAAKFDLSLDIGERDGELRGAIEYAADLFEPATAERIGRRFERLLEHMCRHPDDLLDRLDLVGPDERATLTRWNATAIRWEGAATLTGLFSAAARAQPDQTALVWMAGRMTYGELDARSNQVAHALRSLGVGDEGRVGVCFQRGPEAIVALLGVLKAGAVYVPLDVSYPRPRLEGMVQGARLDCLLTDDRVELAAPRTLRLVDAVGASTEPLGLAIEGSQAAYLIHTSGSSGVPKGVVNTHAGAVNRLRWMWARDPLRPQEILCHRTSLNFADSITEIFSALCAGAPLAVVEGEAARDPAALLAVLDALAATRIVVVPALLAALLEVVESRDAHLPPRVWHWVSSGEALPRELAERWRRRAAPGSVLLNLYGCSEASADSTFEEVTSGEGPVTIGRPIANTEIHIVDDRLVPVPIGVEGELVIAGLGVARGYFGDPVLTAARFVPDPDRPGARMYRTGDRGRHLPDGRILHLGRSDAQIKLRGHRIELGEVESTLRRHPAVIEAVAALRDGKLCAYLVPRASHRGVDPSLWREHLAAHLPAVMIPAHFVEMTALPRLETGKFDRRALPAPAREPASERRGTRNAIEATLVRIWAEVLDTPEVGIDDDFFALGGHSLLAVRIMARIEQRLHVRLPLSALFERRTVALLAARLPEIPAEREPLVVLEDGGSGAPLFLVHPIGGEVLCYGPLARALAAGRRVYGLAAVGPPARSIAELSDRYLAAIRRVHPTGPYLIGGWSFGAVVAFEIARRLLSEGSSIAALILIDPATPGASTEQARRGAFASWLHAITGHRVEPGAVGTTEQTIDRLRADPRFSAFDFDRLAEHFGHFVAHGKSLAAHELSGRLAARVAVFCARHSFIPPESSRSVWSSHTEGPLHFVELPGEHDSLLQDPLVAQLARQVALFVSSV